MRALELCAVALFSAWQVLVAAGDEEDAVVVLTDKNFDEYEQNTERMLVEFYAPWCGHCKSLEPEYKKAANEMKKEGLKTVLAKVDATAEKASAGKFDVSGYPTLYYLVKGKEKQKYEGERTADGIKAWLRKRELPAIVILDDEKATAYKAAAETFAKDGTMPETIPSGIRLVGQVVKKSARDKAYTAAVTSIAGDDWKAVTFSGEVIHLPKSVDPKGKETSLVMWRPEFEDPDARMLEYTGKWSEGNIIRWVKANIFPTVGKKYHDAMYSSTAAEAEGREGSVVVVLDDGIEDDDDKEEEKLRPKVMKELLPLAQAESKKWLFTTASVGALSDSDKTSLGIKEDKTVAVVLKGGKRYHLPDSSEETVVVPGAIKGLVDDVKAKKIKPYYKSAAAPEAEVDELGVTVVTGDTFEKHVTANSKTDVFLEFYAPWCGHCKKLTPIWGELAGKVKKNGWDNVVIAKMDATENESPEETSGYPTLIFYPAGKEGDKKLKSKKTYSGERDLENLLSYLEENAQSGIAPVEAKSEGKKKSKYSMIDREKEKKRKQQAKGQEL